MADDTYVSRCAGCLGPKTGRPQAAGLGLRSDGLPVQAHRCSGFFAAIRGCPDGSNEGLHTWRCECDCNTYRGRQTVAA